MNGLLTSVAKKLAYVVAIFIILAALMVSVSRVLVPLLDSHRSDFEKWASQLLDAPVTINKARISWYQYQPVIRLQDVTVISKTTNQPALEIEEVNVFISIPKSLWHWQPVLSGLMISGSDIKIIQTPTGEFAVLGFPAFGDQTKPYSAETKFIDVMKWLSAQPTLILRDIDVRYTGLKDQPRDITIHSLSFENKHTAHTLSGNATLHQSTPTDISLTARWYGDEIEPAKLKARFYLYVSGLSLSQWFKDFSWNGWQIVEGAGSAKIWATWSQGGLHKFQAQYQLYDLNLFSTNNKTNHKINRFSGDFGWKKQGNKQIIAGDDILIDRPTSLWPATSFYLELTSDANQQLTPTIVNVGYIDLADIKPILFAMQNALSPEQQKTWQALSIGGDIQSANVTFAGALTDYNKIKLSANVNRISFQPWQNFPGVRNLRGQINWDGQIGNIALDSNAFVLNSPAVFTAPIMLGQLAGDIQFTKLANEEWQLLFNQLKIQNDDFNLQTKGTLLVPVAGAPVADLTANVNVKKVEHVSRYLPMKTFSPDLVEWLQGAFISGRLESGNAIIRGPLNDFPFEKTGEFKVTGDVKDIALRFAPDWPIVKNVNGKIIFNGWRMDVAVDSAETMGITANNVHADIPFLGGNNPQILTVQTSDIETNVTKALEYIHASPLEKNIGRIFKNANMSGDVSTRFNLVVSLDTPEAAKVKGSLNLKQVTMDLAAWRLKIDNINGPLNYTEDTVNAENIQATLFDKPIKLNLKTIQKSKTISFVSASTATKLSIKDLEDWLKVPFSKVATGDAMVDVALDLSFDAPINIHLTSNLQGIKLDLPSPYAKSENDIRAFTTDVIVDDNKPLRIKLNYANVLNAALILESNKNSLDLTAANLRIGSGDATWPTSSGLYITGNIDQLDWDKIKSYTDASPDSKLPSLKLRQVDITARILDLFGQKLNNVRLQVSPSATNWDIDISSSQMSGSLQIPATMNSKGTINAQFERLNIMSSAGSSKTSPIKIKDVPSINFTGNNVTYNGMNLGNVAFKTAPSARGMAIRSLTVRSSRVELNASGDWSQSSGNLTRISGDAKSANVSELLNSLGFNAHNFIASKGKLEFDLSWAAAPYALSLASMSGQASIELGAGRVVDIGESSAKMDLGKMLSIFSLQTIPRRLSLDFSDLFQKGYSFDSFGGDFKFNRGNAYTTNTKFEGPVAKIGITGRIGLADKDFDFTLSVASHVTSSLPVAAALVGAPMVGLAVFAVNAVASSAVSTVTGTYYSVKGPWNNPTWSTVSAPRR